MRHGFQRWKCVWVLLAMTMATSLFAAEAPASDSLTALQKVIQNGVAAGRKPVVGIDIFKKAARATVLKADDQGLQVAAFDTKLDLRWKDLETEQVARIAAEMAASGADQLALLRYYVEQKQTERAQKACEKAIELDMSLKDDAEKIIAPLMKQETKTASAPSDAPPAAPGAAANGPLSKEATLAALTGGSSTPQRIGAGGRALPPMPPIKSVVMFNTPEADAILAATQIFPPNHPWNEDISKQPVLPNSDKLVANVGADKFLHIDVSENFVIVPPDQPRVPVKIEPYSSCADPGPYPMPISPPIQGWGLGKIDLEQILREGEGDRHILVLDPVNQRLYEFYHVYKKPTGWEAFGEATFDLTSNKARKKDFVSADASGLAMLPGIIKWHEIERGSIDHAIRLTVSKTRKAYIWPATHLYAGHTDDPNFPAMGQRFRLKASFDISKLPKQAQPIARALQKYGCIVCDNGSDWDLCATPDKRIDYDQMRSINKTIKGSDMEAIVTTGEFEGPRAAK